MKCFLKHTVRLLSLILLASCMENYQGEDTCEGALNRTLQFHDPILGSDYSSEAISYKVVNEWVILETVHEVTGICGQSTVVIDVQSRVDAGASIYFNLLYNGEVVSLNNRFVNLFERRWRMDYGYVTRQAGSTGNEVEITIGTRVRFPSVGSKTDNMKFYSENTNGYTIVITCMQFD